MPAGLVSVKQIGTQGESGSDIYLAATKVFLAQSLLVDATLRYSKANQLGMLVRANLPAAMQGLAVVPLFAGYDTVRARGRVYSYDVTGGRYEELDFQAQGSGSIHARNWIKAAWREGMPADDVVALAITSLFAAADEDVATGGPDLVRRIFPTVWVGVNHRSTA